MPIQNSFSPEDFHFWNNKAVTVTGGAGLIGSFLVEALINAGARVSVADDFSKGTRENLLGVNDRIRIFDGDLEVPSNAFDALEGAQIVFHLASRAYGVGYGKGRHLEILQHNERITNNVLESVVHHGAERVMVVSSSCVYDDNGPDTIPELPLFEGEPEQVNWGYGWSKRFLEQKAALYSRDSGIPITVVRPFNIYGERYQWVGEYSSAIPMLTKRILDGENPVKIWGSGNQRRSYVHASDCARMMMSLVGAGYSAEPVNIGTEQTVSITELVNALCSVAGLDPDLEYDRDKPEGRFIKSADMSRFNSIVPGFEPFIDLREGLERMVGWYATTFGDNAIEQCK